MKHEFKVGERVADCHPNMRKLIGTLIAKIDLPIFDEEQYWCMKLDPPADIWVISPESVLKVIRKNKSKLIRNSK